MSNLIFIGFRPSTRSISSEPLLSTDFPPTDKTAWLAQVQQELKDPAASDSLRWQTGEGFTAEPYYTADGRGKETPGYSALNAGQQAQKRTPGWLNAPGYHLTDDAQANNTILRDALTRGADALVLTLSGPVSGQTEEADDASVQRLSRLLNGIKLSETPVFFVRIPTLLLL